MALFTVFLPRELCASLGQLGGKTGGGASFRSSGPDPALAPGPPPPRPEPLQESRTARDLGIS